MIVDPSLLIINAHLCQWAENKTGCQEEYAQQKQQNLYTHLNDTTETLYTETNPELASIMTYTDGGIYQSMAINKI